MGDASEHRYLVALGSNRRVQGLGAPRAVLAGGNEVHWEAENVVKGIPMGDEHCQTLVEEGEKLGTTVSFEAYERFSVTSAK